MEKKNKLEVNKISPFLNNNLERRYHLAMLEHAIQELLQQIMVATEKKIQKVHAWFIHTTGISSCIIVMYELLFILNNVCFNKLHTILLTFYPFNFFMMSFLFWLSLFYMQKL